MLKQHHLIKHLDALYEFDREPVTQNKLQGFGNFLGLYAHPSGILKKTESEENICLKIYYVFIFFLKKHWSCKLLNKFQPVTGNYSASF